VFKRKWDPRSRKAVQETIKVVEATLKVLRKLQPINPGDKAQWNTAYRDCAKVDEIFQSYMLREKKNLNIHDNMLVDLTNDFTNMLVRDAYWLDHFKTELDKSLRELKSKGTNYNEDKLCHAVKLRLGLPSVGWQQ
jgi:hypothetical protein